MKTDAHIARYNQRNRQMESRSETVLRLGLFVSFLLASLFFPSLLVASNFGDTARQLADRIAVASGPGTVALEVTNRSSLDDKSVREVRSALQSQLRVRGVSAAAADQSVGTVAVVLSESLREYVWTAEITIGSDAPRVVLVSLPRALPTTLLTSALPITLKKTFLFSQEQPILDAALVDTSGGAISAGTHLLVLDPTRIAVYRQQSGHWELEASLATQHARNFPRDVRGRLLLRRDHLFDAYLPGTICRSSNTSPLTLNCVASDDPWPLTPTEKDENGLSPVRAFYAPARNFFTGALSPGIGKISTVPSFYSAAALPRSSYTLWVLAAADGTIHMIDGITDQAVRGARWGSDLAAVHSTCGTGMQLLVTGGGDMNRDTYRDNDDRENNRDTLRAFEIPDRDPIAASSLLEFDGPIAALWPDASLTSAVAIVKHADTGWYEANRISITCAN
ncbi:MAG: hypothetical protein ABSD39_16690 [Terriglobales bacterium]|jgi:hypothetical protein